MKDSYYQQIVEALAGHLDDQVFERCVVDLLRSDFPTIVPIPGGDDAGMDAAIADGEGPPLPAVITTAEQDLENLRRNLKRYVEKGGERREAILVTSQRLTPQKRRNREAEARKLGFTLRQVYDRDALADRLYGSSRWCHELLGLSGQPSAFSRVAESSRPHFDIPLIGRDAERQWLENTSGDRVVVGDPGSGKTFLVHQLVEEGKALYAVEDDRGRLANALRESRPDIVIVDDAHVRLERLKMLRHLREDIGHRFELLATTWEGDEAKVVGEIEHPTEDQILHLELLPRDDIVEIFEACGVTTTVAHLRDLVDQAANKPGLAVTLARLWHQGSYDLLFGGQAVQDETLRAVGELLGGRPPVALLACFALGGDRGVAMASVGDFLGMTLAEIQEETANLAAAGVLSEVDGETLAIWPRQLRVALLGSVFFDAGATALPWRRLFPHVASHRAAVETLAMARGRGVDVPVDELERLLIEVDSKRAWQIYVQMGEREALLGLECHGGDRSDLMLPALSTGANGVIDQILDEAASHEREGSESQSSPMEVLRSWVEDAEVAERSVSIILDRRRKLVRRALERLRRGTDARSALEALRVALSPGLESSTSDPGMGRTISVRFGVLPASALRVLYELWNEAEPVFAEAAAFDPEPLVRLAEETVDPKPAAPPGALEDTREARWQFARSVLRVVAALPWLTVGPAARVRRLGERLGVHLPLRPDPEFELLFPRHPDMKDFQGWEQQRRADVKELATRLSEQEPSAVAARVAELRQEAKKAGQTWPDFTPQLADELARRVDDPGRWLHDLQGSDLSAHLLLSLAPFLDRVVREARSGWQEAILRALDYERLVGAAVWQVLTHSEPDEELLTRALALAPSMADNVVETVCLRGEVPVATSLRLLEHENDDVAIHAAIGEWLASPRGEVRHDLRSAWRGAILRARTREFGGELPTASADYWIREILSSDGNLAEAWLRRRIDTAPNYVWDSPADQDRAVVRAVETLTRKQRRQLLDDLRPGPALRLLARLLVGNDAELYVALLARPDLTDAHLAPLEQSPPDQEWATLARVALGAGKSVDEVAGAGLWRDGVIVGPISAHWRRLEAAFSELGSLNEAAIREVGSRGAELAHEQAEAEEKREHEEALRGW